MTLKKIIYLCLFYSLLQISIIVNVKGDGVIPLLYYRNPYLMIFIFNLLYLLNSGVEYGVISSFFEHFIINKKKFVGSIFKINLITYPFAQGITYIISSFTNVLLNYYVIIVEFLVVIIEFYLLNHQINKLVNSGYLDQSIKKFKLGKIFLIVLLANTITYILGIWIIFPFFILDFRILS